MIVTDCFVREARRATCALASSTKERLPSVSLNSIQQEYRPSRVSGTSPKVRRVVASGGQERQRKKAATVRLKQSAGQGIVSGTQKGGTDPETMPNLNPVRSHLSPELSAVEVVDGGVAKIVAVLWFTFSGEDGRPRVRGACV